MTQSPAEETAALRREAAELLSRSRWYREYCRREESDDRGRPVEDEDLDGIVGIEADAPGARSS
jgi:hypothetical protein